MIEVSGLDRTGLLYDLTNVISRLNLNIEPAHVVTFGEGGGPTFYVTDLTGGKNHTGRASNEYPQAIAGIFGKQRAFLLSIYAASLDFLSPRPDMRLKLFA